MMAILSNILKNTILEKELLLKTKTKIISPLFKGGINSAGYIFVLMQLGMLFNSVTHLSIVLQSFSFSFEEEVPGGAYS